MTEAGKQLADDLRAARAVPPIVRSMFTPPAPIGAVRPRGPSPTPHPADGLAADVNMGGGAFMTILDPRSFRDGSLGWRLAHAADPAPLAYTVVSVIESYDYLLSSEITTDEAICRLRLLRAGRRAIAAAEAPNG